MTRQGWSEGCRPAARRSAAGRAAHNVRFHNTGIRRFHHPVVGALIMSFDDETVRRRRPDDGRPHRRARLTSHDALNLLASWAATLEQAEAANVVDGLSLAAAEPARGSWLRHRIHRSWHYGHAELGFARTGDRAFEGRWS